MSFSRGDSDILYILISEILYGHVKKRDLFFKVLYQILMYLNLDFFKFKYKKFRKHLHNYLIKILPEEVSYDSSTLNNLLHGREDSSLFREAQIIVPHMSLQNLIERLPSSGDEVYYLNDIKSYLQPSEYMAPDLKEHHQENHTS